MKKALGLWGLTAALSLCLTACGMGNARYGGDTARNNANSNGTVTDGDGTLTGKTDDGTAYHDGVTDFGDTARKNGAAYDNGMTYSDGTAYDNGVTDGDMRRYNETARNTDGRSALDEAADALERARNNWDNRTGS